MYKRISRTVVRKALEQWCRRNNGYQPIRYTAKKEVRLPAKYLCEFRDSVLFCVRA